MWNNKESANQALQNTNYMHSVLIMSCLICKVSLLVSALYAKCPNVLVLYMFLYVSALYAKCQSANQALQHTDYMKSVPIW